MSPAKFLILLPILTLSLASAFAEPEVQTAEPDCAVEMGRLEETPTANLPAVISGTALENASQAGSKVSRQLRKGIYEDLFKNSSVLLTHQGMESYSIPGSVWWDPYFKNKTFSAYYENSKLIEALPDLLVYLQVTQPKDLRRFSEFYLDGVIQYFLSHPEEIGKVTPGGGPAQIENMRRAMSRIKSIQKDPLEREAAIDLVEAGIIDWLKAFPAAVNFDQYRAFKNLRWRVHQMKISMEHRRTLRAVRRAISSDRESPTGSVSSYAWQRFQIMKDDSSSQLKAAKLDAASIRSRVSDVAPDAERTAGELSQALTLNGYRMSAAADVIHEFARARAAESSIARVIDSDGLLSRDEADQLVGQFQQKRKQVQEVRDELKSMVEDARAVREYSSRAQAPDSNLGVFLEIADHQLTTAEALLASSDAALTHLSRIEPLVTQLTANAKIKAIRDLTVQKIREELDQTARAMNISAILPQ